MFGETLYEIFDFTDCTDAQARARIEITTFETFAGGHKFVYSHCPCQEFSPVNCGYRAFSTYLQRKITRELLGAVAPDTRVVFCVNSDDSGEKEVVNAKRSSILIAQIDDAGRELVVGTNTIGCFYFFRHLIKKLWEVPSLNGGTQFRSRYFPMLAAQQWELISTVFTTVETDVEVIPDLTDINIVVDIDNFFNIKTGIEWGSLQYRVGEYIKVLVGDFEPQEAIVVSKMFEGSVGQLAIGPGSDNEDAGDKELVELHIRHGHAALEFVPSEDRRIYKLSNQAPKLIGQKIEII